MRGTMRVLSDMELVPTPGATMQNVTVADAAVQADMGAIKDGTTHVLVSVDGADVYATFDGTTPSTVNGHKWGDGANDVMEVRTFKKAKWIRAAGTSATLRVTEMSH